ncbi:MAG: type IV pili methyl-accepting chemotaxis transducer N-terminal domain-containing protein [Candidatus Contendobacter sp.]|nr:type IV pili methyl-accepting chemotaxis transducer N-terminal domain-containing protein [Candidatus Contendobacter sp.]MDS4058933.1 type IV pili methyl-accepting chemotaxis transducer N-terminal domain-containing protein [Candidatus Contendobacter sp.]
MENYHSIIFRSGLTMGGIVLLALLSMVSSVFIAESSKGDAAAINLAGSLRMQSYRIATRLQNPTGVEASHAEAVAQEISEFERRLERLWQTGAIAPTEDNSRSQTLQTIESFWRETLKPILQAAATDHFSSSVYLSQVDDFVAKLDAFVKLLAQDTEAKILLLRLVQGIALFMTVVLIFVAMHQLHTGVVAPLRELVELARKARGGDLSVRASHVGNDELGVLGHAFNLMAADLSAMYADLETRVEQQTQALRLSNRSLELLYQAARLLGESVPDEATYRALLAEIEKLTGMGSVTLCLIPPTTRQAAQVFSARPQPPTASSFCTRPNCDACLGDGATHPLDADHGAFSIPVKDQEQQFGVLIVRNPGLESVAAWQLPLLEAVARNIATALRANEQTEHRRRLALLEERNAIARELHDSLAQSLSYLKIQISRLQTLLGGAEPTPEVRAIVAELREGLSSAYRQLRELLTTFRLKMEHPRLEDSLRETVEEFSRRGRLPVELDCTGWQCALSPNEQVHVMQIVREALNNAVQHARASRIVVRLRGPSAGEAMVGISDDGVGLPTQPEREHHFGLHIMRERARRLGGQLELRSQPTGGLLVRLRFLPTAHQGMAAGIEGEVTHA